MAGHCRAVSWASLSGPLTRKPSYKASWTYMAESDPSVPPQVQTFWQWLREEGVVSSKTPVRPGVVPEGLGLVTQRDIAKTEREAGGRLPMATLYRHSSRVYQFYYILCRSEEELSEIQGTQLLSTTLDVKKYVQSEFLKVKKEVILPNWQLFPFPISLDDFFWAFGIIRSRAFSRLRGQSLVLIPLVDLINHSHTVTTEDHAHEIPGPAGLFSWDLLFSLRSPAPVKAGEQVFIQYNLKKSNAEFVLDYGFVDLMPNRDKYMLTLKISESDPYFGDKLDIAESNDLGQTACFDIILDRPLPPTMFPYLRLIALGGSDAFLLESSFTDSVWHHLELPVSRANEELLCRSVQHVCKSALSGYHTTLEEVTIHPCSHCF
ncbi:unnamed protein product [Ilex paraguariensis]|uniref:SET domain-containing protein n=1 Tax=Ilex paraguariensis TaxID=185542 RepID=A0ABC8QU90_9AQUA